MDGGLLTVTVMVESLEHTPLETLTVYVVVLAGDTLSEALVEPPGLQEYDVPPAAIIVVPEPAHTESFPLKVMLGAGLMVISTFLLRVSLPSQEVMIKLTLCMPDVPNDTAGFCKEDVAGLPPVNFQSQVTAPPVE